MYRTLGIVEVTPSIQRAGLARRQLAGNALLQWVVRRASDADRLDHVAVVVPDNADGRQCVSLVPPDVTTVLSRSTDSLGSLERAIDCCPAESIVRLRLDRPFVDPTCIDQLVHSATNAGCDYAAYGTRSARPTLNSQLGLFGEWITSAAVRTAARKSTRNERADITQYFVGHPDLFALRILPLPAALDQPDLRLTITGEEDWEHVQTIADALGPDRLDWHDIASLLAYQPQLRSRMAALNQEEEAAGRA